MSIFKHLGRNDMCWCGSNKKYKKCCFQIHQECIELANKGYPVPKMNILNTAAEIKGIKKACRLTVEILDALSDIIKPGITTNEINYWVDDYTRKHDAIPAPLNYKGFPKSICTSINEVVCHGIPSERVLKEGDIVNVDVTCIKDGFYGDSCRMYKVGKISGEAEKLINVTKQCLDEAISCVEILKPLNVIGDKIQNIANDHNYGVVDIFGGHGIGKKFHLDPFVYHCKRPQKQMIIVPGMVFTIEPMINIGSKDCEILEDDWTAVTVDGELSAQWEHTVAITHDGVEVLT